MKKRLDRTADGHKCRCPEKPEPEGHVCGAGDYLTRLFCKARRDSDVIAMNKFMSIALSELTTKVQRRLYPRQLSRGFADIVASILLMKVLKNADEFNCNNKIMSWMSGFIRNEIVNLWRAEKKVDLSSLDKTIRGNDESVNCLHGLVPDSKALEPFDQLVLRDVEAQREKDLAALDEMILKLPPLERQVVELRRAGEPNYIVAKTLGIDRDHAATIYFNAKKELRRRIG